MGQTEPGVDLAAALPRLGHELRGPLQVIHGFVELLLAEEAGPLTPDQRRYLQETQRSCERLLRFSRELASGSDATLTPLVKQATPLAALLEGVTAALKPALDRRGQTLHCRVRAGAAHAWCDPARIEQVLHNLIANASEHGPDGGRIDLAVECGPGSELVVSVTDDGPGVPEALLARPGRGLGLEISRAIVAAHGGCFDVSRAPERGARIRFTLPRPPGGAS